MISNSFTHVEPHLKQLEIQYFCTCGVHFNIVYVILIHTAYIVLSLNKHKETLTYIASEILCFFGIYFHCMLKFRIRILFVILRHLYV